MSNIGFDNWSSQDINQSLSSSEGGSPPVYIPSSGRTGRQRDDYSFELSRDTSDEALKQRTASK